MKKSLVAITLTLLASNLCAQITTKNYDSGVMVGVDDEGHVVDGRVKRITVTTGPDQPKSSSPSTPVCNFSQLTIDGKVIARHEEGCEQSDFEEFNKSEESKPTAEKSKSKKKVNS